MACYRCPECDEMKDDDYYPGVDIDGELYCESCADELEDEDESNRTS